VRILAMDTATTAMTIAVMDHQELLQGRVMATERNHSIRLAPEIESILTQSETDRQSLAGIACGVGPGSYTGVRIGVTVAKTMAWALGIPVWELSSMHALAWSGLLHWQLSHVAQGPIWIIPMADARRGQAFTGCYVYDESGQLTAMADDLVAPADDWLQTQADRACAAGAKQFIITGELEAFHSIRDRWTQAESERNSCIPIEWQQVPASAEGLTRAVIEIIHGMKREPASVHDLVPNYTQLAEAESKWLAGRAASKDV
jgi:tRNA threonylcarbamoyladenosine biosynthesis protein TsaB